MGNRAHGGFTLVEMLASMAVLAFMLVVVAGIVGGVLGGSTRVVQAAGEDGVAGEVDEIIADDLAFLAGPRKSGIVQMKLEGSGNSSLSFYSACGARTAWGMAPVTIHKIAYQVRTLPSGGKALFRGEEPLVKTRDAFYDPPLILADAVQSFTVEAYDGQDWVTTWPSRKGGLLPVLIRVRLVLATASGEREVYVESAPSFEPHVRPEAERRASGGENAERRLSGGGGEEQTGEETDTGGGEETDTGDAGEE